MKPIQILRAGAHISSDGSRLAFSEDDLKATASAYDPKVHEAPIVIGHPRENAPAFGWVSALTYSDGHLEAEPAQIDTDFAELIAAGRFKKVSASLYTPQSPHNPTPGVYYLRHIGFLGAQPPAIKGLRPVELAEGEEGVVEFGDTMALGLLARLARGLREVLLEKWGLDVADRVAPGFVVEDLEAEARRPPAEPAPAPTPLTAAASTGFSEERTMQEQTTITPPTDALAAREATLAAREAELKRREAEFSDREAAFARADAEHWADDQIEAGRLTPAQREPVLAFMEAIRPATTEVSFGETFLPPAAAFRRIVEAAPRTTPVGTPIPDRKGDKAADELTFSDYDQLLQAWAEAESAAGRYPNLAIGAAQIKSGWRPSAAE